jgi:hypothetical protein
MDDATSARNSGPLSDEGGLWIDEGMGSPRSRPDRRRLGMVLGVAACVALIGVPIGLLAASGPGPATRSAQQHHVTVSGGPAKRSVLAALSATTDSGTFAFTYQLSESPIASSAATGSFSCAGPACPTTPALQSTEVQGSGTINTDPTAMAASADISTNGVSGLQVGVRVDPTTVWEVSDSDNGLTPQDDQDGGSPLAGFAGLVLGTLGQREGAVAMMGMASPTGYLDLEQPAVTSATEVGPATVDGVAVTQYELTIDPSSLASAPGTSSAEQSAINAAVQTLTAQGYRTIRDLVSIDASGFIRESASTVTFADSGTVTLDAHFSDFGCAGTVLMPGQGGVSTAPSGCVSADTGSAPTTTTTSTSPTTTVPNQSTPTTVPMPPVTTTTSLVPAAPSTTTTTTASSTSTTTDPTPTTTG